MKIHRLAPLILIFAVTLAGCESVSKLLPFLNQNKYTGDWEMAFSYQGEVTKCTMHLKQDGNKFSGTGEEPTTEKQFKVENGIIKDNDISFSKIYINPENGMPGGPPINYKGKNQMVNDKDYQGPYWTGSYVFSNGEGQPYQGDWEAQKTAMPASAQQVAAGGQNANSGQGNPGGDTAANPNGSAGGENPGPAVDADHAPDLSGKWSVAYEYDFKTIKSTMYLEQVDGKITGHGVDKNTNEKFVIEKGWYSFPKLTLIRKYVKGKDAAKDRNLTFKCDVQVVNEKDYQGPYLSGKTEGGGEWEAQLIR